MSSARPLIFKFLLYSLCDLLTSRFANVFPVFSYLSLYVLHLPCGGGRMNLVPDNAIHTTGLYKLACTCLVCDVKLCASGMQRHTLAYIYISKVPDICMLSTILRTPCIAILTHWPATTRAVLLR